MDKTAKDLKGEKHGKKSHETYIKRLTAFYLFIYRLLFTFYLFYRQL